MTGLCRLSGTLPPDNFVSSLRRSPLLMVSGTTRSLRRAIASNWNRFGFLMVPGARNSVAAIESLNVPWAIDNGAFSGFDPVSFRRLLARAAGSRELRWIVCPDKVGDAKETLRLFDQWHTEIAEAGPVAFVGQDGQEDLEVPWDRIGCFFIGGTTRWKLSGQATDLADEANRRGKWVHMGRVNSRRRLAHAASLHCDSVDGSSMSRWGDVYLHRFVRWANQIAAPHLFNGSALRN